MTIHSNKLYLHTILYLLPIKFIRMTIHSYVQHFCTILYSFPIKIAPLNIHSYNTLFSLNFSSSPYQICQNQHPLIQQFICTQFCTFFLSNFPKLTIFTHSTIHLHSNLYLIPLKFAHSFIPTFLPYNIWLFPHSHYYTRIVIFDFWKPSCLTENQIYLMTPQILIPYDTP